MTVLEFAGGLDLALLQRVNAWCGNWALDRIAGFEERNFLLKGGILLSAYWWFWFHGEDRRRLSNRRIIVEALIGTILALVLNRGLLSALPFRARPMYTPDIGYHAPSLDLDYNMEAWSSFPSDSATFWFALSFGLFRLSRPLGVFCMLYSAAWMCLARLYLGVHYPSDLVVGALIGVIGVWLTSRALAGRGDRRMRRLMDWLAAAERRAPHWFYAIAFLISFELTMIFNDVRALARGAVHALSAGGYVKASEGTALFVIGAVVLAALCVAVALGIALTRQSRRRTLRRVMPVAEETPARSAANRGTCA